MDQSTNVIDNNNNKRKSSGIKRIKERYRYIEMKYIHQWPIVVMWMQGEYLDPS